MRPTRDRYLALLRPFVRAGRTPQVVGRAVARVPGGVDDATRTRCAWPISRRGPAASRASGRRARAGDGAIVVTDYLKPDLDEIYGVLPVPARRARSRAGPSAAGRTGARPSASTCARRPSAASCASGCWRGSSGYGRSRTAPARSTRGSTRWLDAVQTGARWPTPRSRREVAQAAQLVKGYGDVRRRMMAVHEQIVAGVLRAVTLEARRGQGFAVSRALARRGCVRSCSRARTAKDACRPPSPPRSPGSRPATWPGRWSRSPQASV